MAAASTASAWRPTARRSAASSGSTTRPPATRPGCAWPMDRTAPSSSGRATARTATARASSPAGPTPRASPSDRRCRSTLPPSACKSGLRWRPPRPEASWWCGTATARGTTRGSSPAGWEPTASPLGTRCGSTPPPTGSRSRPTWIAWPRASWWCGAATVRAAATRPSSAASSTRPASRQGRRKRSAV